MQKFSKYVRGLGLSAQNNTWGAYCSAPLDFLAGLKAAYF